jgi:hypothetical protein
MLVRRIESAVTPRSVWSLFGVLAGWQTFLRVPKSLPPATVFSFAPEPLDPHEAATMSPMARSASARVLREAERSRELVDILGLRGACGITNLG